MADPENAEKRSVPPAPMPGEIQVPNEQELLDRIFSSDD